MKRSPSFLLVLAIIFCNCSNHEGAAFSATSIHSLNPVRRLGDALPTREDHCSTLHNTGRTADSRSCGRSNNLAVFLRRCADNIEFKAVAPDAAEEMCLVRGDGIIWPTWQSKLANQVRKTILPTIVLSLFLFCSAPLPSVASGYGSMSDEQKVVAEAWRLVDNSYLDRTFNGQDWFALRQKYVKAKYKNMEEARLGIQNMVETLGDKYTRYLPPGKYQSIVDTATGTLAGVGVEIGTDKDGYVVVADVEDGSPAQAAGITAGSRFVQVDGTNFGDSKAVTPDDVAAKLRGPVGSRVGITMEKDGKMADYIVTREPITITAVKSYMTEIKGVGKVGVIRIKSFSGTTASTVASQLAELTKKGAQAFVVDIRGNPGGLLPGGVETASIFLDNNTPVVYVVGKNGFVDNQNTLMRGDDLESPVVVLVDGNTASAAEVFAAALQENGRATLVGEKTFGKGVVQTIRPLSDNNGGLSITVSRYETPQHHDINKLGIPVDVPAPVDCPRDAVQACLEASFFRKPQGAT